MHLYRITNKIDGKKYIGITTRQDPRRRWSEHKCTAQRGRGRTVVLMNAIRKHGVDNFEFEVIETFENISLEELLEKESAMIIKENTICPNGYNLKLEGTLRHYSDELGKKLSKSSQGIITEPNKTSKFIGVSKQKTGYNCDIRYRGQRLQRFFYAEEDAARCYDMLAIHLCGRDARLNFKESDYSDEQISEIVNSIGKKNLEKYTSKYDGIYWSHERKAYRARVNKRHIGQAPTEEEAKKMLDEFLEKGSCESIMDKKRIENKTLELEKIINALKNGCPKSNSALSKVTQLNPKRIHYLKTFINEDYSISLENKNGVRL